MSATTTAAAVTAVSLEPARFSLSEADARMFRARLSSFVRRRLPEEVAEDVVQEVFVKLVDRPPDPGVPLLPWLLTVARNAVTDFYRRSGRRAAVVDLDDRADDRSPDDTDRLALRACLEPLLNQLSQQDREILRACDIDGRSPTAFARERGLPASTVKSRLLRARARLREEISACCHLEFDGVGMPLDAIPHQHEPCGACGNTC